MKARLDGLAQNLVGHPSPALPARGEEGGVFRRAMLHQPVISGEANRKMDRGGYCR